MNIIDKDIKEGTFAHIYLITGDDPYLVDGYKKRLSKAIIDDDMMNVTILKDGIDAGRFIEAADTIPFFADRRLVVVEESKWFKSSRNKDEDDNDNNDSDDIGIITKYIDNIPDTTYVIFAESDIDKRNKLYKKISRCGSICELDHMDRDGIRKWILKGLKSSGKSITSKALDIFMDRVGDDTSNISNELHKLIAYIGDREGATIYDVDTITTREIKDSVWDMIDAIRLSKSKIAMEEYADLKASGISPMMLLAIIRKQYNQMLIISDMLSQGMNKKDIISALGIKPYAADKLIQSARRYTREQLEQYYDKCTKLEFDIKKGDIDDDIAIELIIYN